jgi:hypothetical protein
MSELWFQKIISRPPDSSSIFQCKKTKVEIPFEIDEKKIREYTKTYFPK